MNWLAKILVINVALSLSVLSPELVKASEKCELEIVALKRDVADRYEKLDVLTAEVATAKKCVTDFDLYTENEVKFKELTVQLDGLSADLATLKFLLGEQIKELENNLPDTSKVAKEQQDATNQIKLAELLKQRMEISSWPLRSSDNVTVIYTNIQELESQIADLRKTLADVKTWPSEDLLKQLNLEKLEAELKARIAQSNENLTKITNTIKTEYKDNDSFEQIKNQVFALKLTVESLGDRALDLDDNISAAEGKLSRFERACRRKPACKDAVY